MYTFYFNQFFFGFPPFFSGGGFTTISSGDTDPAWFSFLFICVVSGVSFCIFVFSFLFVSRIVYIGPCGRMRIALSATVSARSVQKQHAFADKGDLRHSMPLRLYDLGGGHTPDARVRSAPASVILLQVRCSSYAMMYSGRFRGCLRTPCYAGAA